MCTELLLRDNVRIDIKIFLNFHKRVLLLMPMCTRMVTLSTLHAFSVYKVEPLYTSMRMFEILKYLELSH
jgi:hypothetical protein